MHACNDALASSYPPDLSVSWYIVLIVEAKMLYRFVLAGHLIATRQFNRKTFWLTRLHSFQAIQNNHLLA